MPDSESTGDEGEEELELDEVEMDLEQERALIDPEVRLESFRRI